MKPARLRTPHSSDLHEAGRWRGLHNGTRWRGLHNGTRWRGLHDGTRMRGQHNGTRWRHANDTEDIEPPRQRDRGSYLVVIGVMTAPLNFDRRAWLRKHAPAASELLVRYVLGQCMQNRLDMLYLIDEEERVYGDLHRLTNASDGSRSSHVVKTYEWFRYAMGLDTVWVAKTDDDTLWNVPLLMLEARAMGAQHAYAYNGVMRWRWYDALAHDVCGKFVDTGPPAVPPWRIAPQTEQCRGAASGQVVGPYIYADGSFELLTTPLARAVFSPRRWQKQFHGMMRRGSRAEDPLVGSVVYEESRRQSLPTAFLSLKGWKHNKFWVDLRDMRTMPDASTASVHRVYNSMLAKMAADRFAAPLQAGRNATPGFDCGPCKRWQWVSGTASFLCCAKRDAQGAAQQPVTRES